MKRIITMLVCALCAIVPMLAQGFSGSGSGTSDDPYRIFNADQLNQVRNFLGNTDVFFSLETDIDLAPWLAENNPYEGWLPIGTESSPFQGTFNGNGHTISNLTINRPSTDYIGLFGYCTSGLSIENLILTDCSITGKYYVGGIVGYMDRDNGDGGYVYNNFYCRDSRIIGCEFYGKILGNDYVGGVIGYMNGLSSYHKYGISHGSVTYTTTYVQYTIRECIVRATIIGNNNVGGILGLGNSHGSYDIKENKYMPTISQSYCAGTLVGNKNVGGIIGYGNSISINESSSYAIIQGNSNFLGGNCRMSLFVT